MQPGEITYDIPNDELVTLGPQTPPVDADYMLVT